jgi:hypothetical protein
MPSVLQPMQRRYVKFSFSNPFATITDTRAAVSIINVDESVGKGVGTLQARQQIAG